jgi:hypothetical protein
MVTAAGDAEDPELRASGRPHPFDPDTWSRTSVLTGLDAVPVLLADGEPGPQLPGRSMAVCRCGYGPGYRAHQPRWWRWTHPVLICGYWR